MDAGSTTTGRRRRGWKALLGFGLLGMVVCGVLVVGGAAGLAWTSTEEFCIGCHEMRDTVYAQYKDTIHDRNRTGVRAICTDCHVPRQPVALIAAKVHATKDVWGHLTGVIDTPEKFEAMRSVMAQRVWRRMQETDSIECRNCHKAEKMNADLQSEKAKAKHASAKAEGKTCIDCHFAIAHEEPAGPGPQEMKAAMAKP